MWPFRRKPTAEQLLLERFLQLESDRLSKRSDLDSKREELEVKKLEIELTHLEARTKSQIELDAARQDLLLKRREAGRKGQQVRRANRLRVNAGEQDCGLCIDPNRRDVTVEMIRKHASHGLTVSEESRGNGSGGL